MDSNTFFDEWSDFALLGLGVGRLKCNDRLAFSVKALGSSANEVNLPSETFKQQHLVKNNNNVLKL
jgi:hypothetical protein